jgi:mono/diheme cytochrome c family protein
MESWSLVSLLLLAQSVPPTTPPSAGPESPIARLGAAELEQGWSTFRLHCTPCHGADGTGGRGPSLARRRLRRVGDDKSLFDAIRYGIPGTEMPATFYVSDDETWRVAGFVRSLAAVKTEALAGDAARGRILYEDRLGCAACHITSGTEEPRSGRSSLTSARGGGPTSSSNPSLIPRRGRARGVPARPPSHAGRRRRARPSA